MARRLTTIQFDIKRFQVRPLVRSSFFLVLASTFNRVAICPREKDPYGFFLEYGGDAECRLVSSPFFLVEDR